MVVAVEADADFGFAFEPAVDGRRGAGVCGVAEPGADRATDAWGVFGVDAGGEVVEEGEVGVEGGAEAPRDGFDADEERVLTGVVDDFMVDLGFTEAAVTPTFGEGDGSFAVGFVGTEFPVWFVDDFAIGLSADMATGLAAGFGGSVSLIKITNLL